ncbi:MAG: hypothetical protein IJH64_06665 [Oscillospiraceae bacterium]|nr:hypothetical protein [Oscillospiraceae bacterium]
MCIQLDLFSDVSLQEPIEVLAEDAFSEMAKRQDIGEEVFGKDPCKGCRYQGLCDSDECALKLYRLDSKNSTEYKSWKYGF